MPILFYDYQSEYPKACQKNVVCNSTFKLAFGLKKTLEEGNTKLN